MYKLHLTLLSCFASWFASAQLPVLKWVATFPENYYSNPITNSNGRSIGVDALGNVYSVGVMNYPVDFDPGPGVFILTPGGSFNLSVYITKLDASGNLVWAKQVPTYTESSAIEIEVDPAGNIYFVCDLRETADVDPGPGQLIMSPTGFRDVLVLKIDTNGNLIWGKKFGGPGATGPQGLTIAYDKDYNVVVGGVFNSTVDFDPGPGVFNLTSTAHFQAFLVKLDANGNLLWAKQFGNSPVVYEGANVNDLKCDAQGDIVLTGSFVGNCDFDPGPGVSNTTSTINSKGDGYIARFTDNGDFMWVKTIGQSGPANNYHIRPLGIHIDGMHNIITTGLFIGNFDFDPGPGVQNFFGNPYQCFILKLDLQGIFTWVRVIGGNASDGGADVAVDHDDNVYTIGHFEGTVDYDAGPGNHTVTSPYYGAEALIRLSPNGDFHYAALVESISYGTGLFRRMVVDPAYNIYIVGSVSGINDFDPGPGVFPVAAYSGNSNSTPFVAKLGRCLNATSATLNISTCGNYTLNNQTYDTSGIYTQVIANSANCDSVITLHLTVNKKQLIRSQQICEGESFFAANAYQTTAGTYIDTLHTVLGCDSIVTTHLEVNSLPKVNLGADKNICKDDIIKLSAGNFAGYLWQDNSTASGFEVTAPGVYWVIVRDNNNCVASDTFEVHKVLETPTNFLKAQDSICNYGDLELYPTQSFPSYHWSTGSITRSLRVNAPGVYTLSVIGADGCPGIDSTVVLLKQCMFGVYVPTAFTPNGDGRNDFFRPLVFGKLNSYRFTVYNRWGEVVFQSVDPSKGWDGKIGGVLQTNAVFVWVCAYQLEGLPVKTEKGTVTLIH